MEKQNPEFNVRASFKVTLSYSERWKALSPSGLVMYSDLRRSMFEMAEQYIRNLPGILNFKASYTGEGDKSVITSLTFDKQYYHDAEADHNQDVGKHTDYWNSNLEILGFSIEEIETANDPDVLFAQAVSEIKSYE